MKLPEPYLPVPSTSATSPLSQQALGTQPDREKDAIRVRSDEAYQKRWEELLKGTPPHDLGLPVGMYTEQWFGAKENDIAEDEELEEDEEGEGEDGGGDEGDDGDDGDSEEDDGDDDGDGDGDGE